MLAIWQLSLRCILLSAIQACGKCTLPQVMLSSFEKVYSKNKTPENEAYYERTPFIRKSYKGL
jgi:hypothetical protein